MVDTNRRMFLANRFRFSRPDFDVRGNPSLTQGDAEKSSYTISVEGQKQFYKLIKLKSSCRYNIPGWGQQSKDHPSPQEKHSNSATMHQHSDRHSYTTNLA